MWVKWKHLSYKGTHDNKEALFLDAGELADVLTHVKVMLSIALDLGTGRVKRMKIQRSQWTVEKKVVASMLQPVHCCVDLWCRPKGPHMKAKEGRVSDRTDGAT